MVRGGGQPEGEIISRTILETSWVEMVAENSVKRRRTVVKRKCFSRRNAQFPKRGLDSVFICYLEISCVILHLRDTWMF